MDRNTNKLVVLRLGENGKDLACVSVSSYDNAITIARNEYPELHSIPVDRIQLKITAKLLDGTSQVVRLTHSGFQDTLALYEPLKLVTIQILPPGAPPNYSKKVLAYY